VGVGGQTDVTALGEVLNVHFQGRGVWGRVPKREHFGLLITTVSFSLNKAAQLVGEAHGRLVIVEGVHHTLVARILIAEVPCQNVMLQGSDGSFEKD
jgi:hypothetical protein